MKIYVKPITFECHTSNPDGTYLEYETPFFNGKCKDFIEGHRCVPLGHSWTRSDDKVFDGEMITLLKPLDELDEAQREYEKKLLAEYETALAVSVPVSDLTAAYQEGVNAAYDQ